MLSEELNLRLSQVADSLMNILQVQITKAINSAINNSVIPEIQMLWVRYLQDRGTLSPVRPKIIRKIEKDQMGSKLKL